MICFVPESVFLLPVVYEGVVHLLAFGVRPFLRDRACLAIFGDHAADCHHGFPAFLADSLDGVVVDFLHADHVGVRHPGHGIILAIVFRAHLEVDGLSFSVGAVDRELQAIGLRFNREGAFLRRWTGLYLDLATLSFQVPAWLSAAWAMLPRTSADTATVIRAA